MTPELLAEIRALADMDSSVRRPKAMRELIAEVERLRAENAKLRAALTPFASIVVGRALAEQEDATLVIHVDDIRAAKEALGK